MNQNDIYTAGLIDGEGTITLSNNGANEYRSPVVSVTSTTYKLVEFLKVEYGGSIVKQKVYQDHHKQSWIWTAKYSTAMSCLKRILPYMKEPEKIRRGQMIINEYPVVTKRNGKYSNEDRSRKLAFEHLFFHPSAA